MVATQRRSKSERIIAVLTCSGTAPSAEQDCDKPESGGHLPAAETCKLARDTRLTRASELILSAPGGPDCEQPSACTTAGTTRVNSDAASTVATATAVEDKVVWPPQRAYSLQPCGSHAKDALTPSLAVTSAGANSSHVSCDALRGERSRTTPLAIASEGANSSASDVFQPGLSQDEVRQRIRQGMGSGVGPRYDIVELAQCMTAFEQSLQAELERQEYETGACARPNADLFLSMGKTDWASLNSSLPRRRPKRPAGTDTP